MDLFTPIAPPERLHPHFAGVLDERRAVERLELLKWADGFPDRDGKFVHEFQTTFNSSFWEIYLFAAFKDFGLAVDWSHSSPDFFLTHATGQFVVEATTANAADGKIREWEGERGFKERAQALKGMKFGELNREAMIRISSALLGKLKAYRTKYIKLDHVRAKPFVIALAPFEQPNFQLQYDRPIRAVLYDHYVDEDAFLSDRIAYPNGPPTVNLGFITKDNGTEIPLGIFANEEWAEVSAVIFSCVATWGKISVNAGKGEDAIKGVVWTTRGGKPGGKPHAATSLKANYVEGVTEGLQIYHNPFARRPLDPSVFRKAGVVQHYYDKFSEDWVYEEMDNCLHTRMVISLTSGGEKLPAAELEAPPRELPGYDSQKAI